MSEVPLSRRRGAGGSARGREGNCLDCCIERHFFMDNLLVRIHFIIVMIK